MTEERIYFWSMYVILVIVIFVPMLYVMEKSSNGDSFNEKLIAYDLGLVTDLLIGFDNGNYEIEYFLNDADYYVGFEDKCKFVVSIGRTSGSKYFCSKDLSFPLYQLDVKKYNSIILEKNQILNIPRYWWHAVINLEATMAVTYHYYTFPHLFCNSFV